MLIEVESSDDTDIFETTIMQAVDEGIIEDALLALNETQKLSFWNYRDAIADIIADIQPAINFDIGIPITEMDSFVTQIQKDLHEMFEGIRLVSFGHIGDGNLHFSASTGKQSDCVLIEDHVFKRATAIGGTITAEHGIGVLKKDWLSDCRSEVEIELMRRLKALLDPAGILNAGRVI